MFEALKAKGYGFENEILEISKNTLNAQITGIKVQFLGHLYKNVNPVIVDEGVRMYDCPDIAAMKLNAVSQRNTKKDFWDIDLLLDKYSLHDMFKFYEHKYDQRNFQHILRSLTWFEDADMEKDPICLRGRKWTDIKKRVIASVKIYVDRSIAQRLNENKLIIQKEDEKKEKPRGLAE